MMDDNDPEISAGFGIIVKIKPDNCLICDCLHPSQQIVTDKANLLMELESFPLLFWCNFLDTRQFVSV